MKKKFLRIKKNDNYIFYEIPNSYSFLDFFKKNEINKKTFIPVQKNIVQSQLNNKSPLAYYHLEPCFFFTEDPNHHYFAIGKDKYNKVQYIYHPYFQEYQRKKKYCDLTKYIHSFKKLNKWSVETLKNKKTDDIYFTYALMYQLMTYCRIRVGSLNDGYAPSQKIKTYGVRTLEKKHFKFINDHKMILEFVGKKGIVNTSIIRDPLIIKSILYLLKRCKYSDEPIFKNMNGNLIDYDQWRLFLKKHKIDESKTIRTYYANLLYIERWLNMKKKNIEINKKNMKINIEKIADELHHTPSILKKSYLSKELYNFSLEKKSNSWIVKNIEKKPESIMFDFFNSYCNWITPSSSKK